MLVTTNAHTTTFDPININTQKHMIQRNRYTQPQSAHLKSHILAPCIIALLVLTLCVYALIAPTPISAQSDIEISLSGAPNLGSSLVVVDLNGDGPMEIVSVGQDGRLYLISGETNSLIWEKDLGKYLDGSPRVWVEPSIAAADLDNDGRTEIAIALGGLPITDNKPGALIVLSYVGGSTPFVLADGWPQLPFDELGDSGNAGRPDGTPDSFVSSPALGDIDGDGDKEIVIGGMDRRIHAWHHDGSRVGGWPIGREKNMWRDVISTASLADIDNDGVLEVIIGTNDYSEPACANPYLFYVIEGDGTFVPGFPVETTQNIASSPAVGDIDNDGWLDIVVGTGSYSEDCGQEPDGHKVYAWDHKGQPKPGWPRPTAGNMETSPALGDLDGDGTLEVVIGCNDVRNIACNTLYAFHADGRNVSGFPMVPAPNPNGSMLPQRQSAILADIDGDNAVEILQITGWDITVIEANGQVNRQLTRSTNLRQPPGLTVIDVDNDGLLETVASDMTSAGRAMIHIWQETAAADAKVPWPMFKRSVDRAGVIALKLAVSGRVLDAQGRPLAGVTMKLDNDQSTMTDSSGQYVIQDVANGRYVITPTLRNRRFVPPSAPVTLPSTQGAIDFREVDGSTKWLYLPNIRLK